MALSLMEDLAVRTTFLTCANVATVHAAIEKDPKVQAALLALSEQYRTLATQNDLQEAA